MTNLKVVLITVRHRKSALVNFWMSGTVCKASHRAGSVFLFRSEMVLFAIQVYFFVTEPSTECWTRAAIVVFSLFRGSQDTIAPRPVFYSIACEQQLRSMVGPSAKTTRPTRHREVIPTGFTILILIDRASSHP
jgi:hypothetical protein